MTHISWIVAKFGGTSVRSSACWQRLAHIADEHIKQSSPLIIVCSAIAGISDALDKLIHQSLLTEPYHQLELIKAQHVQLVEEMGLTEVDGLSQEFADLERLALGISYVQDASPKVKAAILAKGELLSTRIGIAYLNTIADLPVSYVDARTLLHSEDDPQWPTRRRYLGACCSHLPDQQLQAKLNQLLAQGVNTFLTQGFIGSNPKGETVVFGRGGSDTSAAYLAAKLCAKKLHIWTDVPGLFTANPHQVPSARLIKVLDYSEAQEMASSGAKVLHPRSIEPLQKQNIPLEIGWTHYPHIKGTVIHRLTDQRVSGVKSISVRYQTPVITLESFGMWQQVGFLAKIFDCFKQYHLSIDLVTTSETNVSVTLDTPTELDDDTKQALIKSLSKYSTVAYQDHCATISLVGKNIRSLLHELGPSLAVFEEQNIYLVSQAASDLSLTFVVDEDQAAKIVKNLHAVLFNDIDKMNPLFGDSWQNFKEETLKTTSRYQAPWWEKNVAKLLVLKNTPCYVYHLPTVTERIDQIKSISAAKRFFYSVKANNNPSILSLIAQSGIGFECVSINEINHLLSIIPNLDPKRILFTPNFIHIDEYKKAIEYNVWLTIDNPHPLIYHPEVFAHLDILLRIDTGLGRGHHQYVRTSGPNAKFGIWPNQLELIKPFLAKHNIQVVGLHAHCGSGILTPETWAETAFVLHDIAQEFSTIEFLDLGGGLGIPERPDQSPLDEVALNDALSSFSRLHPNYELWLEPGRFLVAQAGVLLTQVNQLKRKGERHYIGVDAGMHSLIRPALYSAYHSIVNISRMNEKASIVADVVGPICESGDVLGRARHLPNTEEGDMLLLANTGAYGEVMTSNYNMRAKPLVHVITDTAD